MCWSLRVSIAAGCLAHFTAAHLWKRNKTPRDRWNAIFLGVFGLMQWVDAGLWFLVDVLQEPLGYPCSNTASAINILGMMIIILEPVACLVGSMYARGKWWTREEFVLYILCNFSFQFFFGFISPFLYDTQQICQSNTVSCPFLTENNHLLLAFGVDSHGGAQCWMQYGFFGKPQAEIPLWLRLAYLIGMVYPYLRYSNPCGSGIVQSLVLISTWLLGYFSDSHASVWCLANVLQAFTMLADPYWFPKRETGSPILHKVPNTRDLYNKRKVQKSFDFIICGSGIGGLTTAAMLSLAGYRCLVLEAHYRAGGCTHEFKMGNTTFDTGIHYLGNSGMIRGILAVICDSPGVALEKMGTPADGFCYDEFDLGDDKLIRYEAGEERVKAELIRLFPHERKGISALFKSRKEALGALGCLGYVQGLPDWILDNFPKFRSMIFSNLRKGTERTAKEVVEEFIQDPKLRALLSAGQLIDWNLQPSQTSWAVCAAMSQYYGDGGYYPIGGSRGIAEKIIPVIERAGGRVLCRARVAELLVDQAEGETKGTITGVRLVNGDELFARRGVVSDMGIVNTLKVLPDSALKDAGWTRDIPSNLSPGFSNGHMTAFICLDGPAEMFELRPSNIHSWMALPAFDFDPSKMQENFYKEPLSEEQKKGCLMTITAPSVKDPEHRKSHPNTSNVILLTEGRWEWFKNMDLEEVRQWYEGFGSESSSNLEGSHGKRPAEYLEFKEKWKQVFLDRLYHYYPKTKGHVTEIKVGTPVTSAHFLNSPRGASYGLAWGPKRFDESLLRDYMRIKSKVPGLYLTGESAMFGGFAGAMGGGMVAAMKILGLFKYLRTLLSVEGVDADEEYWKSQHPDVKLAEETNRSLILQALFAAFGVMLSGRRFGKAVTRTILSKKLN